MHSLTTHCRSMIRCWLAPLPLTSQSTEALTSSSSQPSSSRFFFSCLLLTSLDARTGTGLPVCSRSALTYIRQLLDLTFNYYLYPIVSFQGCNCHAPINPITICQFRCFYDAMVNFPCSVLSRSGLQASSELRYWRGAEVWTQPKNPKQI